MGFRVRVARENAVLGGDNLFFPTEEFEISIP